MQETSPVFHAFEDVVFSSLFQLRINSTGFWNELGKCFGL